jgi:hypothetical protein
MNKPWTYLLGYIKDFYSSSWFLALVNYFARRYGRGSETSIEKCLKDWTLRRLRARNMDSGLNNSFHPLFPSRRLSEDGARGPRPSIIRTYNAQEVSHSVIFFFVILTKHMFGLILTVATPREFIKTRSL